MSHVFISYVHEDNETVQRLYKALRAYDIQVWLDRDQLKPGYRWADAIRKAIREGAFYIACFSSAYNNRPKTYMNEELTLAIEEMRQRPTHRAWFIPVLVDDCDVPDRNIGAGETLRSVQWVNLHKDWNEGIKQILSVIRPDSAKVHELLQALGDKSARVRIKAADELSLLGRTADVAISPLIEALDDENETVRAIAAYALGEIGKATELVLTSLVANIHSKGYHGRYANHHAIKALAKLGKPGIEALIRAESAKDTSDFVDSAIIEVLSDLGKPIIAILLEMLANKSVENTHVYDILSRVHDPNAISELMEALQHEEIWVRIAADMALVNIRDGNISENETVASIPPEVLSTLIEAADGNSHRGGNRVCNIAIHFLGKIGEPASASIPTLIQAMDDSNLRLSAIVALGKIGRPSELIVPVLIKALHDRSEGARKLAITALGEIGRPSELIVPVLIKALHDRSEDVRQLAITVLGKIGGSPETLIPALIKVLDDPDAKARKLAVIALGEIGGSSEIVVPALIKMLSDPAIPVRDCVIIALGKVGNPGSDVVIALIDALKPHHNRSMRVCAAEALGEIGDPTCIPALIELQNDQFEVFRIAATSALKQLGLK